MTADDSKYPETHWDEARIALRRVIQLFNVNPDFTVEELRRLKNYVLIPEPVREMLEGLTPDERQLLNRILTTLQENHFFFETNFGGGLTILGY
jgi:hypothetical protein